MLSVNVIAKCRRPRDGDDEVERIFEVVVVPRIDEVIHAHGIVLVVVDVVHHLTIPGRGIDVVCECDDVNPLRLCGWL